MFAVLAIALGVAIASLAVVDPAPAYDPWAWLLWGREVTELRLSTPEGPAFKPLPVAVCALLAPLGGAAPWLWVLIARTAAVVALLLAFRVGERLSGGSRLGGLLASVAVLATGHFAGYAASGVSEGMLLALALAGFEASRSGRPRTAIACAGACALLRVETWPLLALAAAFAWQRQPARRPLLAAVMLLVPIAWFLPEWLGSGDLLRSGERARIPNPGQPALADVPALASLAEGLRLVPWPVWPGMLVLVASALRPSRPAPLAGLWRDRNLTSAVQRRIEHPAVAGVLPAPPADIRRAPMEHPLGPALVGVGWIAIVAAMAQAGFSGEARYAMPGAALIGISGAAGIAAAVRMPPLHGVAGTAGMATLAVVLLLAPRADHLAAIPAAQAHQWRLAQDLERAVTAAGGRERVLACGTPYVGRLRGPLMAYALDVEKSRVEPDAPPSAPGVVFRSPLRAGSGPTPDAPAGFAASARAGDWLVLRSCSPRALDTIN